MGVQKIIKRVENKNDLKIKEGEENERALDGGVWWVGGVRERGRVQLGKGLRFAGLR